MLAREGGWEGWGRSAGQVTDPSPLCSSQPHQPCYYLDTARNLNQEADLNSAGGIYQMGAEGEVTPEWIT